jgi:hypothetical protein
MKLTNTYNSSQCNGNYLSESNEKVHMLMFADDTVFINYTVGRMQHQLNEDESHTIIIGAIYILYMGII